LLLLLLSYECPVSSPLAYLLLQDAQLYLKQLHV
jgi:hypothetical protein